MARTLETSVEISGVLSPSLQAAIRNAVNQLEEMSEVYQRFKEQFQTLFVA